MLLSIHIRATRQVFSRASSINNKQNRPNYIHECSSVWGEVGEVSKLSPRNIMGLFRNLFMQERKWAILAVGWNIRLYNDYSCWDYFDLQQQQWQQQHTHIVLFQCWDKLKSLKFNHNLSMKHTTHQNLVVVILRTQSQNNKQHNHNASSGNVRLTPSFKILTIYCNRWPAERLFRKFSK